MEIQYEKGTIKLNRVLSVLDEFVLEFIALLDKLNVRYVLISGYLPLLFGRVRITEDVDIFLENLQQDKLKELYGKLEGKYWCLNSSSQNVFFELWKEKIPIRMAKKEQVSPNMEVKQTTDRFSKNAMENSIMVMLNGKYRLRISPLELQIAYKLFLGSKKDLEDARFLYDLFKNNLDKKSIAEFAKELNVPEKLRYLGGLDG